MVELIRIHGVDHAQLVGHFLEVRNGVRHPESTFTVLLKAAPGSQELWYPLRESKAFAFKKLRRAILTIAFYQLRFVVVEVQVGR